jgi:hypothetical protein
MLFGMGSLKRLELSKYPQAVPYFNWYSIGKELCRFGINPEFSSIASSPQKPWMTVYTTWP